MQKFWLRRVGVLVVAGALAACGSDSAPQASEPESGEVAATSAAEVAVTGSADWVEAQLTDGVVVNEQYESEDIGLTIEAALTLQDAGRPAPVDAIAAAVAERVVGYTQPGYGTEVSAGGTAKAVLLAQAAEQDPTDFGGLDLIDQLESAVVADGAASGRILDRLDPAAADAADYSNVIGQAYAVRALDDADSELSDAVTDHLLLQQCEAGFFRGLLSPVEAPEQDCDAAAGEPDVDATGIAVRALAEQADDPEVQDAIEAAGRWLVTQQDEDGSIAVDGNPNSNSTGLAAVALEIAGQEDAALEAAEYVLGLRVTDPESGSALSDETGAIAYDAAALATGERKGIPVKVQDQWRRATFQAVPALGVLGSPTQAAG